MTHDNAMVETVARAICDHGGKGTPVRELYQDADYWRAHAKAALEASHHAELVEALTSASERLGGISLLYRARLPAEELAIYDKWAAEARALLAKIGGDA